MAEEYKLLDQHLGKIDQDQLLLESKLELLEKQIKDLTKIDDAESQGRHDIINKCVTLNKQVSSIEHELDNMLEEFNHDNGDGSEIRPDRINLNTQEILNNYFEIL